MANVCYKTLVPGARGLLQTIQRALQQANMIRTYRINKTRRLLAVNRLLQMTMEKSILHIKLVDWPGSRSSDADDDSYHGRFDDGAERLVVVDAVALREPANHPTRLVAGKGTI